MPQTLQSLFESMAQRFLKENPDADTELLDRFTNFADQVMRDDPAVTTSAAVGGTRIRTRSGREYHLGPVQTAESTAVPTGVIIGEHLGPRRYDVKEEPFVHVQALDPFAGGAV